MVTESRHRQLKIDATLVCLTPNLLKLWRSACAPMTVETAVMGLYGPAMALVRAASLKWTSRFSSQLTRFPRSGHSGRTDGMAHQESTGC
jgi:hypothetical protein